MKKIYTLLALAMLGAMSVSAQTTGTAIFTETFDGGTKTGGEGPGKFATGGSSTFTPDNVGWTSTASYSGYQCAKFGKSGVPGDATTPSIDIEGPATLTFDAAPWGGVNGTTGEFNGDTGVLTVLLNGTQVWSGTLTQDQWNPITVQITGNGASTIEFLSALGTDDGGKTIQGRFWLDNVVVTSGDQAGIEGVTVNTPAVKTNNIYTIDGKYVGTDVNALPKGVYIVNGKKIVKD